jgi:phosphopantothenoylcysteine decarboxylase / phosphopantothenate---cysteine ligase
MTSPRVLLMISGGIAAYKACFLARLLMQAGFSVKVAMTEAATRFVTPMTFQALTGNPVATDLWGERQSEALDHIEYARWADLVIVAPATANTMAKAATGIADDIVSTLLLAYPGPVLLAPAMNDNMWSHAATQANLKTLHGRGVATVGPGEGWLACGTNSRGRMSEPEDILAAALEMVDALKGPRPDQHPRPEGAAESGSFWSGKRLLITAGPTHEVIDPVRYVANRSSGAMGYALAAAAVRAGAKVHLVSGPVGLVAPRGLHRLEKVATANEMADAVSAGLEAGADWLLMAAAVADFTPAEPSIGKLKKESLNGCWTLEMKPNPDILAEVVPNHRSPELKIVGFALETDDLLARATAKRQAKNMDYIVANNPTAPGAGFGLVNHQVTVIGESGLIWQSESAPKDALAAGILKRLAETENENLL